ncbi:alpha/beta hydrolase [Chondromyces apiculatus]|nr:alpha/beta hydrolase-fold protein [Chondromyces apiculatus]
MAFSCTLSSFGRIALPLFPLLVGLALAACGGEEAGGSGGSGAASTTSSSTGPGSGGAGQGGDGAGGNGQGGDGAGGQGGQGGQACQGGGTVALTLDSILAALRADRDGTLLTLSREAGFPVQVPEGYLVINTDPSLTHAAGDHDNWMGNLPLTADQGFSWAIIEGSTPGDRYKFTNLDDRWFADPWARSYTVDNNGEISLIVPTAPHLDRYRSVGDAAMPGRELRVWVPEAPVTHVLYAHDGQNLFFEGGAFGSWHLEEAAPSGMLIVGIDNTDNRLAEYTHVPDHVLNMDIVAEGDAYADFLQETVRPLVQSCYGEPGPVGVMGSSLGGLISLHIGDRYPGAYDFVGSFSGTVGWGSIGDGIHNETMIERYAAHTASVASVVYLDAGGGPGSGCTDSDGDGVDDDTANSEDNYCENVQMRALLLGSGVYVDDQSFFFVWDQGAQHSEAAWAARAAYPLGLFADL